MPTTRHFRDEWRASRNFVQVPVALIQELGSTSAIVLARIAWRCEGHDNAWKATLTEVAEDVGMSKRTVGDTTRRLREQGYLMAERASWNDATLVWSVTFEDEDAVRPEVEKLPPGGRKLATSESPGSATSSYKTGKTTTRDTTTASPAATAAIAALTDFLGDHEHAEAVYREMREQRPDIKHPAQFLAALDDAAECDGFLSGLGVA